MTAANWQMPDDLMELFSRFIKNAPSCQSIWLGSHLLFWQSIKMHRLSRTLQTLNEEIAYLQKPRPHYPTSPPDCPPSWYPQFDNPSPRDQTGKHDTEPWP
ncbi:hypothetical protein I7I50_06376 [Histoplasma capsulatum G186AR]|uniref:Uncharacterized protein n=1 Tax=Ajellomyces capsulatus TaxID=5037 RepID=A0A8H7Z0X4_AJECA|nr:hypothetical protein I7I52_10552 [Histoplasma capsulatum]QSS67334.1 hypothetical protein I7I50_06376 [Histoplasma capsulatum G186AR]